MADKVVRIRFKDLYADGDSEQAYRPIQQIVQKMRRWITMGPAMSPAGKDEILAVKLREDKANELIKQVEDYARRYRGIEVTTASNSRIDKKAQQRALTDDRVRLAVDRDVTTKI